MADGRRVLVTGASGGAGPGVLGAFLDHRWRVVAVARRDPPEEPEGVTWVQADLAGAEAARAMVAEAVDTLGGLDALVCLTGGFSSTPIDELGWGDFERQLAMSLRPTVEAVVASLPVLRQPDDEATIVTIGSQTALRPGASTGPYGAVKGAVATWSLSLATGLRSAGIRVNCVLPGTIDTEANRDTMPDAKRETWVSPRQLGELIVYLSSPVSAPLTGASIPIG
jgi:NAD(P)-dependent dehydrogenase (short-subunit alcohol dehydrogenase family)